MLISLNCLQEEKPGTKWQEIFNKTWPFYKKWFLIEGHANRYNYPDSFEKLKEHMPELVPIYEHLNELAGGTDLAARFLSMYCPPAYLTACTQLAWTKKTLALMRNYDYSPKMFEGVLWSTNWLQPVIGISDCNWGLLDGMNASGLAASLTFGGRKDVGIGFGIPIVVRYILETCKDVKSAVRRLKKIPVHMSYNITLIDKYHNHATVYLAPDKKVLVTHEQVAVNHQTKIEWPHYANLTATQERMDFLRFHLADPYQTERNMLDLFFQKPLYCTDLEKNFATLYTSIYRPLEANMTVLWPGNSITQSFRDFEEKKLSIDLTKALLHD